MCLNGSNPELTANVELVDCPHLDRDTRQRVNFCGCCFHRMCDMCASVHPMPTKEQERVIIYPCHLAQRDAFLQKEQIMEKDLQARWHGENVSQEIKVV